MLLELRTTPLVEELRVVLAEPELRVTLALRDVLVDAVLRCEPAEVLCVTLADLVP